MSKAIKKKDYMAPGKTLQFSKVADAAIKNAAAATGVPYVAIVRMAVDAYMRHIIKWGEQ